MELVAKTDWLLEVEEKVLLRGSIISRWIAFTASDVRRHVGSPETSDWHKARRIDIGKP